MTFEGMQIGIGSYTYGWAIGAAADALGTTFNELVLVDRAVSFGLSLIQLGDNLPLHTFTQGRLQVFKEKLIEKGVQLQVGAKGLTLERLITYISLCRYLDVRLLRFIIDEDTYRPSPKEVIALLKNATVLLRQAGIVLAIENHDRFRAKELSEIILSAASDRVGICLDTANSLGAAEGLDTVIGFLAPYTVNLHIKDFGIQRLHHQQGFIVEGRIAGSGVLDIRGLGRTLASYGHCHSCILEQWVPPEDDVASTIRKEADWAAQSMLYLKSGGIEIKANDRSSNYSI